MADNEGWQAIQERGQQTLAVMSVHAPALVVGEITLASHTADVDAMPALAQAVKDQEDVVDDKRVARDGVLATIKDLTVRMPRKLEGELGARDPFHGDIRTIRNVEIDDSKSAVSRGQRTLALLKKYNARNAAAVPAKPPLTVGGLGIAALQTAVDAVPVKTQDVEDELAVLTDKRGDRDALMDKVDTNNKRLYVAMQGEFPTGSAARAALSQIDTGSPGGESGGGGDGDGGGGPPPPTVPGQAQITNLTGNGTSTVSFDMTAEGATLFDLYAKVPGSNDSVLIAGDLAEPHYIWTSVAGSPYFVKAVGKNAQGAGQESDEVNFSGPA